MDNNERLELARALVAELEAGNEPKADELIRRLSNDANSDLFNEVGRLTRELHEAINGFLLDGRVAELAEQEIPDASERLSYVIEMTERSANNTLTAVEASLPIADQLGEKSAQLSTTWQQFRDRQLSVDEFRQLSRELGEFLQVSNSSCRQLHERLTEVLLAQDFQDLTGQIIRQVITLVHDVEERLVQLIKISGGAGAGKKSHEPHKLAGPAVPGVDQGDMVSGQDDVDELLSSLGF